jgi:hypothetical protein
MKNLGNVMVEGVPPATPGDRWRILFFQPDSGWSASASFPYEMGYYAKRRLRDLENVDDIRSMLTEWGDGGDDEGDVE